MEHQAHIERCSLAAATLLHRHTPWVGRVHSCYARILNIQAPSGQLLTLQGQGALQAPCAASLAEDIETCLAHLSPGDLVVQGDHPSAALQLMATSATIWDGRLCPLAAGTTTVQLRSASTQLAAWLAQHASQRGITPVLAALNASDPLPLSRLHRRVFDGLTPIHTKRSVSTASILQMATQLIGLGEGLTPSGDDLIVGFLAVLHMAGQNSLILSWPELIVPCLTNTPDLSGAFLRCAQEGHFSEPLVRLVLALYDVESPDWTAYAARLARVGHSSGVDAMVGIAIASRVLSADGVNPPSQPN